MLRFGKPKGLLHAVSSTALWSRSGKALLKQRVIPELVNKEEDLVNSVSLRLSQLSRFAADVLARARLL